MIDSDSNMIMEFTGEDDIMLDIDGRNVDDSSRRRRNTPKRKDHRKSNRGIMLQDPS